MITNKDIKISVNERLLNNFNIEINSRDVSEGFTRPSFFVGIESPIRSSDENQVHKSMTIQIYYFPSDRYDYSIEVMDIQEQLENLFDLKLRVQDRFFNIDEVRGTVTDGVLSFSFDIEFFDGRDYEDLENNFIEKEIINDEKYKEETGRDFYDDHPVELIEVLEMEEE